MCQTTRSAFALAEVILEFLVCGILFTIFVCEINLVFLTDLSASVAVTKPLQTIFIRFRPIVVRGMPCLRNA